MLDCHDVRIWRSRLGKGEFCIDLARKCYCIHISKYVQKSLHDQLFLSFLWQWSYFIMIEHSGSWSPEMTWQQALLKPKMVLWSVWNLSWKSQYSKARLIGYPILQTKVIFQSRIAYKLGIYCRAYKKKCFWFCIQLIGYSIIRFAIEWGRIYRQLADTFSGYAVDPCHEKSDRSCLRSRVNCKRFYFKFIVIDGFKLGGCTPDLTDVNRPSLTMYNAGMKRKKESFSVAIAYLRLCKYIQNNIYSILCSFLFEMASKLVTCITDPGRRIEVWPCSSHLGLLNSMTRLLSEIKKLFAKKLHAFKEHTRYAGA